MYGLHVSPDKHIFLVTITISVFINAQHSLWEQSLSVLHMACFENPGLNENKSTFEYFGRPYKEYEKDST